MELQKEGEKMEERKDKQDALLNIYRLNILVILCYI